MWAERRSALPRMNRPDYWLAKFSKLRVDRARGDPAPHKPLLLLALCDLAEQGDLPLPKRVAGAEGAPEFLLQVFEFLRVFAQRLHGQAAIFLADASAVLQGIELGVLLGGGAARPGGMLGILARGGEQRGRKLR